MNKYNILYLHNMSEISGGERSLLNLWENLDRKKFQLHLIIPKNGPFYKEASKLQLDIDFLTIPKFSPMNVFGLIIVFIRMAMYIKTRKINLIHSYSPRNNMMSSLVGKFLRIPVIWHERNLLCGLTVEDEMDLTKKYLHLPDRVICNSNAVAERFRGQTGIPSKVRSVLNGVNLVRFKPREAVEEIRGLLKIGDKKVVGIVSNFSKRKRIEFFLDVAEKIKQCRADVLFIIIGGDFQEEGSGNKNRLRKKASELGLGQHVVFLKFQNDVQRYLSVFDVATLTAIKEACSRSIIEAMATGLPIVAINDGGNPELVEDNVTGILIKPDDVDGFAQAILKLLTDDQLRLEMGLRGRERTKDLFDVKRNAKETEEIYSELLTKSPS